MGGASRMQRHAHLRVLKAAAVSIPFARFFERPTRDAKVLAHWAAALGTAIRAAEHHEGGLGAYMLAVADKLERDASEPLSPRMKPLEAQAFAHTLAMIRERAALDTAPETYAGRVSGPALDAAVAACIPELGEIFDFAEQLGASVVSQAQLPLPQILRATSFATAVGASCKVDDIGMTLASVVTLELPEHGFTEDSLYAAPYLLAHEVICHAAQGVLGPFPRIDSGNGCAWSDGWMDCLAYEDAMNRLGDDASCPDWIAQGSSNILTSAHQAFASRYMGAADDPDLQARLDARAAWHEFAKVAKRTGLSDDEIIALRRRLSLWINAHNLPFNLRQDLIVTLSVQLQVSIKDHQLIDNFKRFLSNVDIGELIAALAI